ncbi:exonuclease [Croceibacter phage P2559Y]|uniref:exonuclease n=1 Tax=Croceibacter phage P2559Y TaxID=1327037 RepID=UPI0003F4AAC8|nr:exonuclease [Croceibacter phage P2559Y]AGM14112.1 exonuclease [Croceibacter phage P2559Y]
MVKIFYDVETTGTKSNKHSIHQLSGIVEVDGVVAEEFNYKVRPHPKAEITKEAMSVCGKTEKEILAYPEMGIVFAAFSNLLKKYVNPYEKTSKAWLIGFNNRSFDDLFLRMFFELNKNPYYNSWFWSDSIDVLCLASEYLMDRRTSMPSFKLKRVALELGLLVDENELHDALFDARITRDIYRIVTGIEIEL